MSKDEHDFGGKTKDLHDVEMLMTPGSPKGQPAIHTVAHERKSGREKHKSPSDSDVEPVSTQPLLEPDKTRPKPPLAGPEVDDLDDDPPHNAPYPGIDDGLLETDGKKPDDVPHEEGEVDRDNPEQKPVPNGDPAVDERRGAGTDDGKWWNRDETDYPYDGINGFGPNFEDRPISPVFSTIPDVNTYQQKKNLAQGMMDLALLSANANQLRYVLESSQSHPYFYPSLVFISFSILLQVAVGVGLIMNSRYNVKDDKDICKADKINNMTVLGVFLITIVNVFITSFSVATPTTVAQQGG